MFEKKWWEEVKGTREGRRGRKKKEREWRKVGGEEEDE